MNNNIIQSDISYEMKNRYIDYAMSVIVGRALPDVRDGLKPVHRRILYAMYELGLFPDKGHRKCARIVGDVLGKYHPHGDTAVYDALVRMAQDFSIRYTLVDGHGNFGSVDGDSAAAMRYTEAKMGKIALEMLRDINKNTVDFVDNFDGEEKEPSVLPSRFPNLLVNGSSGIAVGMTTNIPPHNLCEVIDGILYLIDNNNCNIKDIIKYIPSPDFPTKATIINPQDMLKIYNNGKGKIIIRSKYHIEKNDKYKQIVFTEIPYQSNKSKICENITNAIISKDNILKSINDIRDESDKDVGIRIVVEMKKSVDENKILAKLFKNTKFQLQVNYNAIFLAIVNNQPKILNLKQMLQYYIEHQKKILTRRTEFDLNKSLKKLHILEGLKKAILNIDKTIKLIKESKNKNEAKNKLINFLTIDEEQSNSILNLKLQRLTGLEIRTIENEYNKLIKIVKHLKSILSDEKKLLNILKIELIKIKNEYGDKRKTELVYNDNIQNITKEDLIENYNCKIIYTKDGYIKKLNRSIPFEQHKLKNNDKIIEEISSTNKTVLLLFTNKANRYKLYCHELNICNSPSKSYGEYIPNIINLEDGEKIIKIISIENETKANGYIISTYENGKIAKVDIKSFISANKKLTKCYAINNKLLNINHIINDINIFLVTTEGKGLIINTSQIKSKSSKNTQGNQAIKIKSKYFNNNKIINCIINPSKDDKFSLITKKNKEIKFNFNDTMSNKRTLFDYMQGNLNNSGNFLVNCRSIRDEILLLK